MRLLRLSFIIINMKHLFLILFICVSSLCFSADRSYTLKEKIMNARSGDYIVTEQAKTYSLLLIRLLTGSTLTLEEISIPEDKIDLKKTTWREWVKKRAPGNTSWIIYTIDLDKNKLINSYSYSKKGWLYIDESEYFFAKLLTLPLQRTPEDQKRRIGPPPLSGEVDNRSAWFPPMFYEGKKVENAVFDTRYTKWPEDDSRLSGSIIDLYFDARNNLFPFPFWIEVKDGHFTFKIRTVDGGRDLISPLPLISRNEDAVPIRLQAPSQKL